MGLVTFTPLLRQRQKSEQPQGPEPNPSHLSLPAGRAEAAKWVSRSRQSRKAAENLTAPDLVTHSGPQTSHLSHPASKLPNSHPLPSASTRPPPAHLLSQVTI